MKPNTQYQGVRIQLHPATDHWMRGERFGHVIALLSRNYVRVKLDVSGRTIRLHVDNIGEVF